MLARKTSRHDEYSQVNMLCYWIRSDCKKLSAFFTVTAADECLEFIAVFFLRMFFVWLINQY